MGKVDELSVLVVEHQSNMQTQLRSMLALCGITRVQSAMSATTAVRKLKEGGFDIVLSENNLGAEQTGQHLLEDIRQHQLAPLTTLFIMITSEGAQQRVVSTAELVPNDYILKPFTTENLHRRLQRALSKRDAFTPMWQLIENGKILEAITACEEGLQKYPQYELDFTRQRAELLVSIGQIAEAQALYSQVLRERPVPWAQLGLAKTQFLTKNFEQAELQLKALLEANAFFLDSYDWLARTQEAKGDPSAAREALAQATKVSPHVTRRLRRLGELELELGECADAEKTLTDLVEQTRYSGFRDPEDYLRLVKAQLGAGATERAETAIRDLDRSMRGPKAELCKSLSQALLHAQKGNEHQAAEAAERAAGLFDDTLELTLTLKKDLTRACLTHKLEEQATDVVMNILRNTSDDAVAQDIQKMFGELGQRELGEVIATRQRTEVKNMMATGAELAQKGDFSGAVEHMAEAAQRMPGNTLVLFNAALAQLKYIEHCGWNERHATQARELIGRLRTLDPGNTKLGPLHTYFNNLSKQQPAKKRVAA
ncbi:MAG: response regulator [Betaproteobacteria bacterium]|nr:response regulator [Betaproteobacteria bacterium]